MAKSLRSEVARLEAEVAVLRATQASPRIPSISLCRAIVKAQPAIQRKLYIERTGSKYATSLDVAVWVDECLTAIGLA